MQRILAVLIIFSLAFADIKNWLDSAVYELESGDTIDTQSHKLYYGGGFRLRTNDYSFQPFTVIPPKLRAGCGGIDLVFGGFGYFQPEYLVKFGQKIIQQAPAFAFKIALETFCPSCQKIMTELENLANLINNLSLSSCQIASSLSDFTSTKLREYVGNIDVAAGIYNSILKAREKVMQKTNLQILDKAVNRGVAKKEIVRLILRIRNRGKETVSLAEDVMLELARNKRASRLFTDATIRQFVKKVFGDVEITIPDNSEKDITVNVIKPEGELDIENLVAGNGRTIVCITSSCKSIKAEIVDPQLDSIVNKIITRTPLDRRELEFLAMFPLPAYKLLNYLSASPGLLNVLKEDLSKWMAYELTKHVLSQLSFHYSMVLIELMGSKLISKETKEELNNFLEMFNDNISKAYWEIQLNQKATIDKIKNGLTLVEEFEKISAKYYLTNPAYSSYLFWQTSGIVLK